MHRFPRKPERAFALLVAVGFVALLTMGVMASLVFVQDEAQGQGQERLQRQAFWAAEAGLAEGREAVRLLLGGDPTYTSVITALGNRYAPGQGVNGYVKETSDGFPSTAGDEWYEVLPLTPYTLSRGSGKAIDDSFGAANTEMNDWTGTAYPDYPRYLNVGYRVFLRDDNDGDGDKKSDKNGQVWIVSVGEVSTGIGRMPVRQTVEMLLSVAQHGVQISGYVQKGGGAEKSFTSAFDGNAASVGMNNVANF